MIRPAHLSAFVALLSLATPLWADEPDDVLKSLRAPDGWVIETIAASPLVGHPMMAGFDDQGRLYVAEAAGVNLPRKELEAQLPNFIRRLEDVSGDGKFDRQTIFADRLTFPQGALWHQGTLYAASSGAIWKFRDDNDDGVAEHREPLVEGFGYTGNAADVHGPFLSPFGRIFWCEGRHGHEIKDAEGKIISKGKAARIFSCLPNGTDLQIHCGGGMDNPVEIDFTPEGEILGDVNLFYRQRGDCFVHWLYGGVYPREDQPQCLDEFKRTGDLLPEVLNLGHVAVSGLCRTRAVDRAGTEEDPHEWFVTLFNAHKVVRLKVWRQGSTFKATAEDFLTSTYSDWHPTDVLEDADGSLIVVDTGGWFLNGCPTSQVAKPSALGAIYRVRRRDAKTVPDPRGKSITLASDDVAGWAKHLDDPRWAVREKAIDVIAGNGPEKASSLLTGAGASVENPSERMRLNALLAERRSLAAQGQADGNGAGERDASVQYAALRDSSPSVRLAAVIGLAPALRPVREGSSADPRVAMLSSDEPQIQREAAAALGRSGRKEVVASLLARLESPVDRPLEHAIVYALIELNSPEETLLGLASKSPAVQRGALIALDQMDRGSLTAEQITPLLSRDHAGLRDAALGVMLKHPEWEAEIERLLVERFSRPDFTEDDRAFVRGAVIAGAKRPAVQALLAATVGERATPLGKRSAALEMMARARPTPVPASWPKALAQALATPDDEAKGALVRQAIDVVATLQINSLDAPLRSVAHDTRATEDLRAAALAVVAGFGGALDAEEFKLLAARLDPALAPPERLAAARALGAAKLEPAQLLALAKALQAAGPLEAGQLFSAFEKPGPLEPGVATALVDALSQSPGLSSLASDRLVHLPDRLPASAQPTLRALVQELSRANQEAHSRLDKLAAELGPGDVNQGKQVFIGKRAACSSCHRIAGQGGDVGPDLSTIGQRRNVRDLLEAVIYPSLSLARGFETYTLETDSGKSLVGVVTRETSDTLTLRLVDQTDVVVPRAEVVEMSPNPLSVMPAGLDNTMSPTELRDLIAYLRSLQ